MTPIYEIYGPQRVARFLLTQIVSDTVVRCQVIPCMLVKTLKNFTVKYVFEQSLKLWEEKGAEISLQKNLFKHIGYQWYFFLYGIDSISNSLSDFWKP